jgi:hypothetical protein
MRRSKQQAPLIIESYPEDYTGYPFVTLIRYNSENMLTIVNKYDVGNTIDAYVLDLCGPQNVNEEAIVSIADDWFSAGENKHPISIHFSKLGVNAATSKILRTFNVDHITRIIGPVPVFDMTPHRNSRRRKRKDLPKGVIVTRVG